MLEYFLYRGSDLVADPIAWDEGDRVDSPVFYRSLSE